MTLSVSKLSPSDLIKFKKVFILSRKKLSYGLLNLSSSVEIIYQIEKLISVFGIFLLLISNFSDSFLNQNWKKSKLSQRTFVPQDCLIEFSLSLFLHLVPQNLPETPSRLWIEFLAVSRNHNCHPHIFLHEALVCFLVVKTGALGLIDFWMPGS